MAQKNVVTEESDDEGSHHGQGEDDAEHPRPARMFSGNVCDPRVAASSKGARLEVAEMGGPDEGGSLFDVMCSMLGTLVRPSGEA